MSQPPRKNRRKLKNLLLDPYKQVRHALLYFALIAAAALILQTILLQSIQRFVVQTLLQNGVDPASMAVAMDGPMRAYLWRSALLFPLLALFCMFFALRMTHRFLGPQVAINRHIDALRDGDYGSRCQLRKDDELQELCDKLNELADALEQRHAGSERPAAA